MQPYTKRTDLAADSFARLSVQKEIKGAELNRFNLHGVSVTELSILSDDASNILCKPVGKYYTVELEGYIKRREEAFTSTAQCLCELLHRFDGVRGADSYLIACLGNINVTPDAIGPLCADSLIVTRHLKSSDASGFAALSSVSVLRTGVLGTSGIESADTVAAICKEVKPDCVIAVDALATSELNRLCKTVQLCDSGIAPGSGVGNNRAQLNSAALGIPVISVGVPTVIDASSVCSCGDVEGLFVTPRNIDELVASSAKLIAYGINLALHKDLSLADIELLVE